MRSFDGVELKFNPYHDPSNGQFTTCPGGSAGGTGVSACGSGRQSALIAGGDGAVTARGANIRAFEDPMTLEQSAPGLDHVPGGAMVAVANNIFDITGPADEMTREVLQNESRRLTAQIMGLDPAWHYDEIVPTDASGHPTPTSEGLSAKVNDLRFQRAAVIARVNGDYGLLQVETLRFVQRRTDVAYDQGLALLKAGRLTPRL